MIEKFQSTRCRKVLRSRGCSRPFATHQGSIPDPKTQHRITQHATLPIRRQHGRQLLLLLFAQIATLYLRNDIDHTRVRKLPRLFLRLVQKHAHEVVVRAQPSVMLDIMYCVIDIRNFQRLRRVRGIERVVIEGVEQVAHACVDFVEHGGDAGIAEVLEDIGEQVQLRVVLLPAVFVLATHLPEARIAVHLAEHNGFQAIDVVLENEKLACAIGRGTIPARAGHCIGKGLGRCNAEERRTRCGALPVEDKFQRGTIGDMASIEATIFLSGEVKSQPAEVRYDDLLLIDVLGRVLCIGYAFRSFPQLA